VSQLALLFAALDLRQFVSKRAAEPLSSRSGRNAAGGKSLRASGAERYRVREMNGAGQGHGENLSGEEKPGRQENVRPWEKPRAAEPQRAYPAFRSG
jgi:hypothetical protein